MLAECQVVDWDKDSSGRPHDVVWLDHPLWSSRKCRFRPVILIHIATWFHRTIHLDLRRSASLGHPNLDSPVLWCTYQISSRVICRLIEQVVSGTYLQWVIYGDHPSWTAFVGMIIIVICGIYAAVGPICFVELMIGSWSRYGSQSSRPRGGYRRGDPTASSISNGESTLNWRERVRRRVWPASDWVDFYWTLNPASK
jgi:hypothetical protein